MHPHYRCFEDEGLKEFEYFCDRILSRLRPRDTKYRERKTKEPLSAIFTPSDEAFAMMIIYNEKNRWENIPDPATLEATEVSKKHKWKNAVEKNSVLQQEEPPTGGRRRGNKCIIGWLRISKN